MKELIQLEGDNVVKRIPLNQDRYRLGRGHENDIVFDAGKVSRLHAVLIKEDDAYYIVDSDSINHVFVNGQQVKKKKLISGDRINLSQEVLLLYQAEDEPDEAISPLLNRVWEVIEKKDFLRLKEVTERVVSLDDLDQILNIILTEVIRLVNAERGFIALADEQGQLQLESNVISHNILWDEGQEKAAFSHSVVQRVVERQEGVFLLNTHNTSNGLSDSVVNLHLKSVMCSPLLFGHKLVGVLYVDSEAHVADFDEIDQFFFTIFSDHAAIAIENAKLYHQVQVSNQVLRAEMEETEARYRQLVDFSPEAIAVHRDGKILFVNPAAVELLRAENSEQLIGAPVIDRVHPHYRDIVLERIRMENEGLNMPPMEEKFLRLDGTVVDVEVVGVPFVYQGEQASLAIFREITRRKRMEQELLRAQKLESVGVLAGGIAHDFNNILQVIRGNALMAKANTDDQANVDLCLTAIEKAVKHAVSLTSQLLTFSKGGTPVTRSTPIGELLEDSAAFALRGSNVAYTLELADDLHYVEVDSDQINQVIHNLILNAQQSMPNGGHITISAANMHITEPEAMHRTLHKGNYVKIAIRDEGVGMSEDVLQRIFDPYFTTKPEGSGLGLASCYSIITRHRGAIEAESEEGQGSTFILYLPVSVKQPNRQVGKESAQQELWAKVLLMDDDRMVLDTAGRMLRSIGCDVEVAADGNQAIEFYLKARDAQQPFDLVIFDLTVPGGLGGKEALKKLKKVAPQIKAIVASGYSNDPVMANPAKYGFDGVISKPFDVEELAQVVKGVCHQ